MSPINAIRAWTRSFAVLGLVGLSWMGLSAKPAHAALIVYEGFVYPPGTPLPAMAGGLGWQPGPWTGSNLMIASNGSLWAPMAQPSQGVALRNTAPGECFRNFAAVLDNTVNDIWLSVMEKSMAAGTSADLMVIAPSGAPMLELVKQAGSYRLAVAGALTPWIAPSNGPGQVDFFVAHLFVFNGVVTNYQIWLNPTAPVTTSAPSFVGSVTAPIVLDTVYYRSDPGEVLDEIRIGTLPTDVAAAHAPCPGDLNGDGVVDLRDLSILLSHYGATDASPAMGDLDYDGDVDLGDLSILLSHYGQPC